MLKSLVRAVMRMAEDRRRHRRYDRYDRGRYDRYDHDRHHHHGRRGWKDKLIDAVVRRLFKR
jgi:hypothetical protein